MGLCRYLPLPSDRMGVLWSLLNITDGVVLEYGPAGTTHFSGGFFSKVGISQENRYFTTHMNEDDVVMGDVSRLEKAIVELDEDYEPRVIFVVASSISAVIGTDLKGVCTYMQDRVNAKLITFESAGLRGDYSAGLIDTYDLITKELVTERAVVAPNTFNIIGASYENYRTISDVNEIKHLMKTAFDFNIEVSLCTPTTIDNIKKMSSVTLNLVTSYEGLKAAEYLKETYNTPYIYGAPYGYKGTLEWLNDISQLIGIEINPDLQDEISIKLETMVYYPRYKMMMTKYRGYAYIYADYDRVLGFTRIMDEFCIDTDYKICKHSLKFVQNKVEEVNQLTEEKERIDILKSNKNMLVLADEISIMITDSSNTTLCVSTPLERGRQIATHLPFMGLRGMDFMRETVEGYLGKMMR